jgi:N-acetylglutamate synthase-like GNAT family acetyltransferase
MEIPNDLPPENFSETITVNAAHLATIVPPFSVREAVPADAPAICDLITKSYSTFMQPLYKEELLERALPRLFNTSPSLLSGGTYFVADAGGVLLGAGGWSQATPFGQIGPKENGHMRRVAVLPSAARNGIGNLLADYALRQARTQGVKNMFALSSLPAEQFFEQLGFRASGEVTLTIDAGVNLPAIQMSMKLDERLVRSI